jgi:hypothetical protein
MMKLDNGVIAEPPAVAGKTIWQVDTAAASGRETLFNNQGNDGSARFLLPRPCNSKAHTTEKELTLYSWQQYWIALNRQLAFRTLVAIFLFFITACGQATPSPANTPTNPATPLASPTATRTPAPTPTPAPPLVVFLAPENADSRLAEPIDKRLADLAKSSGYRYEKKASLSPEEMSPELKVVAAIPPYDKLRELADAAPQVQFLGIEIPGLGSSQNLSVIGAEGLPIAKRGFLAGALAALTSEDWRTGIISVENDVQASLEGASFANGMTYFCGLCRPALPPYVAYPISIPIPAGAGQEAIQTAVDDLVKKAVNVIYVTPGVESPDLLAALAQAGIHIIGTGSPASDIQPDWVASLQLDPVPALEKIWSDLAQGKGGQALSLDLTIQSSNPALLTPGREAQAKEIMQDLLNGYIGTGSEAR